MTNRIRAAALAALFLCGPASAMTAADFLTRADALKAKGMMALFSSDLRLLKEDFYAGARAWKAQAHKPNACPPGPIKVTSEEIYDFVAAVPAAARTTTTSQQAIIAGLNRKYSCR